jgi:hypothetical protein
MKFNFALPFAFLLCLAIPMTTNADILALYEFDTTFTDPAGNNFDIDSENNVDMAAGNYNTRSSINNGGVTSGSSDQHAFTRSMTTNNSILLANNDNYHEFSVQTTNGVWSIDSIHFEYWVNQTGPADSFRATVYSDLVGYGAGDEIGTYNYVRQTNLVPEIHNVTFNGLQFLPQFQQLAQGTTATFRIQFSDNQNDPNLIHRVDDVELRGFQVEPVPEPSSLAIFGIVATAVLVRRKKR